MPDAAAQELLNLRALDTLRSGDSTSTKAGTLEYFVKRKGVVGILSNAHVTKGVGSLLF